MIRVRHLIGKQDLLSWIDREDIVKVLIVSKANRELKNEDVCEIYAFYKLTSEGDNQINTILGSCAKAIILNDIEKFLSDKDHSFVNGIQGGKGVGWISKSKMERLIAIESKYEINLSISKEIKEIVNTKLLINKSS